MTANLNESRELAGITLIEGNVALHVYPKLTLPVMLPMNMLLLTHLYFLFFFLFVDSKKKTVTWDRLLAVIQNNQSGKTGDQHHNVSCLDSMFFVINWHKV